jgi:hypothetical protein
LGQTFEVISDRTTKRWNSLYLYRSRRRESALTFIELKARGLTSAATKFSKENEDHSPCLEHLSDGICRTRIFVTESGAEATAVQALARGPGVLELREAFWRWQEEQRLRPLTAPRKRFEKREAGKEKQPKRHTSLDTTHSSAAALRRFGCCCVVRRQHFNRDFRNAVA